MVNVAPKRVAIGTIMLGAVLAMSACSSAKLLPIAEAGPKNEQLSTDISAALNAAYPGLELTPELAGGWEPVMKVIEPVLKDAGFLPITDADSIAGGWTGMSSKDGHSAKFRIFAKGSTRMYVSAKVADEECLMDR